MSTNRATGNNEMQSEDFTREEQAADAAFAEASENSHSVDPALRVHDEVRLANDRALRAQAELENFRKRMRREMEDERRYSSLSLISDLLPAIDNLERALSASETSQGGGDLLQGVKMVQMQFLQTLERHHCRRLGSVGEAFDPAKHQALAQEPSDHPAGTITRITQYGYQLHDRVVRPAQVFVSSGPKNDTNQNN